MMNERKYDLTTGGILHKLLLVAIPIMGTQLLQMSYNLTDMFWLGRVSSDAVAASGAAGMFMWLSNAFIMLGRMGAEIGVAQSLGRDSRESAISYAQNALFLAGLLGLIYGLFLIVLKQPLVGFFNIQERHVVEASESYLSIIALAMPFNFLSSAMAGIFNASGNSRTPFLVNAMGLALNMILDPLAIIKLNMGINGAAYATVFAQVFSFLLMLAALLLTRGRPFERLRMARPRMAYINQMLRWSVPVCLESMFFTSMSMITSRFVSGFGASAIAVSRVGSQIESLSWLIGGGFSSALTAYIGQNFGAGKWRRIHTGFRISLAAMSVWGVLVTALIYFGGGFLFSLFLPEPKIISMGIVYLQILALCQLPQCFESVAASTFRGIGRTLPPSLVSVLSNIIRVFLSYFLSISPLGLNGVWLAISLTAALRGVSALAWYLGAAKKMPRDDVSAGVEAQAPLQTA